MGWGCLGSLGSWLTPGHLVEDKQMMGLTVEKGERWDGQPQLSSGSLSLPLGTPAAEQPDPCTGL